MLSQNKNQGLVVYSDGGARGNPGPAASAFVIFDKEKNEIARGKRFLGTSTNNYAEYFAVGMGMKWILKHKDNLDVQFFLDSELVCRQLLGEYKVKNRGLLPLFLKIKEMEKQISGKVFYKHILRGKNKLADSLVNQALDESLGA